ncbi:D-alanyl-D-alanine carboxypeptidase family protein [Azospirillum agricola]|uniref:D-alanyl-D-alanine carboxypeptidase family protein n=1 Tax=Azospirillum agricola TaxID=1720247 RepID=UPI000A0F20D6|nr:D-alanyl-D-alanine carboxypeptidase family protein [Azospirillum agricola]SMH61456.1 D-alanyl-D-alanine carboxypeptidase [Azospirillum lipoferum]
MFTRVRSAAALLTLVAVSTLSAPVAAKAKREPATARPVVAEILMDAGTGRVLRAHNADVPTYPASLTKMMTLLLTFEALDRGQLQLDQLLPVSYRATTMAPSRLGVAPGDSIRVEDAILALSTKSANDVAVVLGEALAGNEVSFAQAMTKRARDLGMTRTVFRNASGLPDRAQRTTARDMAILSRVLVRSHARYYPYFSRRSFDWQNQTVYGHNRVLDRYDGMDGIKTGYIAASGFNLAASASRDGRRLIAVVLGGESAGKRDRRIVELMDSGFRNQAPEKPADALVAAGTPGARPAAGTGAAVARTGAWAIQTGVYGSLQAARQDAETARRSLGALAAGAKPTVQQSGSLYKAQLVGFDGASARSACQSLKSTKADCIAVQPRP